ncbi:MAG: nucleoside deaminase [Alphaproteobacteria bacterium]|nr:nucleoside deaminase [Alphaproteobacteria bacterium]
MQQKTDVITNKRINKNKLEQARAIIAKLQIELPKYIARGHGPFLAAIYDPDGHLIAKKANRVVLGKCSHHHAEMEAISAAEKKFNTYDLSKYNLSLYVTSEPCIMCLGGIMWSGIREVYFGVPSKTVEKITGFDEGFKPDWINEFKRRGITVCGNLETSVGEKVLRDYVKQKHTVYKPKRK